MSDELKITVIARIVGESQPLLGINRQNVALMFILNLRGVYKDIRIFSISINVPRTSLKRLQMVVQRRMSLTFSTGRGIAANC